MQFDSQKTVFIIDGSSFLYRAYYGLRPLHTPSGEPVQAVYSFCRMIKKIISSFKPEYCALVWDSKGPTTRHEIYPAYKSTRQAPPSDLFEQKKRIVTFAQLIGLRQVERSGVEADDLMFSLAQELTEQSNQVVFITSDKDMSQALSLNISIYDPFKDEFIDAPTFAQKMGFEYTKLPFYYALLGDTSDNIPGVSGIGKKGAADLVAQFSSLADLYEHIDRIAKPRTRQLLLEQKDNAFLSERLFLLQYHATGLSKADLSFDERNWIKARSLFEELHFTSLIKETIDKQASFTDPQAGYKLAQKYSFILVTRAEQLEALCEQILQVGFVAMDTETDGLDSLQANLVGISCAFKHGEAYYVPCGHKHTSDQMTWDTILEIIRPVLENPAIEKCFHNAKWDQEVLAMHGVRVQGQVYDTMVASSLVLREWQKNSLKDLSLAFFEEQMLTFQQVVTDAKLPDFSYVPLDIAVKYAAADAHQTLQLYKKTKEMLKQEGLLELYSTIEQPITQILTAMELAGIHLDAAVLDELREVVGSQLATIEEDIKVLIGSHKMVNLNSPKQVEQLLFVDLGLPPKKKSAKGSYSTDQSVLEELSLLHPVPGYILKHRELFKLKSTYIDTLPTYINPRTSNIHTTYNQIATATGRLSSYDPNLQNIPVSGYGLGIRRAFVPSAEKLFLAADYSQMELRILAHLSNDENLRAAFASGRDIHTATASRLFELPVDQVTSAQRQLGKRINFSILYGLTPYGLSQDLKITFSDAKTYIQKYFEQYPGVLHWMEQVVEQAKQKGYVTTYWGRRRYIPAIYEKNRSLYEEARRVAINTVAQGTAAEIMKLGMIRVYDVLQSQGINAPLLLQIHDELLFEVPIDRKNEVEVLVKKELESVVQWNVPFEVTVTCGATWAEVSK